MLNTCYKTNKENYHLSILQNTDNQSHLIRKDCDHIYSWKRKTRYDKNGY